MVATPALFPVTAVLYGSPMTSSFMMNSLVTYDS